MRAKNACLIINPRAGQNMAKLTDVLAVLTAAGWHTDIALKEYGGHTLELATEAAGKHYDLVIAYGGDGTLNQVVNGVMNAKGQRSIVGIIPGGTANVWAGEIGVPGGDPVKSALTLVNSEARKVDIGHVAIEGLSFPAGLEQDKQVRKAKKARKKGSVGSRQARHHFLLMAGLGIDAAIMGHVSKPMKYRLGPLAVGAAAAKELPEQHAFPVEIRAAHAEHEDELVWRGEALQVVMGNTRRYADVAEMTPDAYIDDGILDVAVITAGSPLSTLQQVASLLLRRKPDNLTAEFFHGAHLVVSVPSTIGLQLDGSAVKLKDYLDKAERGMLQRVEHPEQVMVNYRFDAMPRALRVAIPCTYDNALFAHEQQRDPEQVEGQSSEQAHAETPQTNGHAAHEDLSAMPDLVQKLMEQGRKVTVVGASPNPAARTYIVAGGSPKSSTGESRPVAVRIDDQTTVLRRSGATASPDAVQQLPEGTEIVVEGKKSKRGVIAAERVIV